MLKSIYAKYSDLMWRPVSVEIEGEARNAMIFDLSQVDEDDAESFFDDLFCDGMPENLDLDTKIPFLVTGFLEGDFEVGDLDVIAQPESLLFLDIENAEDGKCPVYYIEVGGTAIVESFKKLCDDVNDLVIADREDDPAHKD
ncbi:hypothetical protein HCH_04512 [Hahella chejuensis KCTC 2396]|uniref:Uncharacterized protein n=1 Tax=Hahella chejuensis (strain KCTC 2396) TaxID=349521 RepID=Q2SDR1_HAHCH|nr:hypothetical protein [Hahella chejuensis]ABC31213.1 hypothetical protein HCH_04512 [Hahella chejuensis KCTC 2396]